MINHKVCHSKWVNWNLYLEKGEIYYFRAIQMVCLFFPSAKMRLCHIENSKIYVLSSKVLNLLNLERKKMKNNNLKCELKVRFWHRSAINKSFSQFNQPIILFPQRLQALLRYSWRRCFFLVRTSNKRTTDED